MYMNINKPPTLIVAIVNFSDILQWLEVKISLTKFLTWKTFRTHFKLMKRQHRIVLFNILMFLFLKILPTCFRSPMFCNPFCMNCGIMQTDCSICYSIIFSFFCILNGFQFYFMHFKWVFFGFEEFFLTIVASETESTNHPVEQLKISWIQSLSNVWKRDTGNQWCWWRFYRIAICCGIYIVEEHCARKCYGRNEFFKKVEMESSLLAFNWNIFLWVKNFFTKKSF